MRGRNRTRATACGNSARTVSGPGILRRRADLLPRAAMAFASATVMTVAEAKAMAARGKRSALRRRIPGPETVLAEFPHAVARVRFLPRIHGPRPARRSRPDRCCRLEVPKSRVQSSADTDG